MRRAPAALFLAGLFFGGGLDHLIFVVLGSPTSHYGLTVGIPGQLVFATLDFSLMALLCALYVRWNQVHRPEA